MPAGYSLADRLLHRVALGNLALQKSLADLESHLNRGLIAQVADTRPVFVTSLPRAGTTLLLEALDATGRFAAQTYRDMPFVLCPLLWDTVSRGFRRSSEPRERAHGDGMNVGFDSPEAFEEVLWKAFWPAKYADDHVLPWSAADRDPEFEAAFSSHRRKVIALRGGADRPLRYLSKNNANIARLPLLAQLCPDGTILVPFRNPADHVGSLTRQHANFLERHAADAFARTYMEWLGHYEFGRALRPIAVPDGRPGAPAEPDFWLDYWDRVFRHALRQAPTEAVFVDYDRLCEEPGPGLARLADALAMPQAALAPQAERFRPARHYPPPAGSPIWASAQETYAMLQSRAI